MEGELQLLAKMKLKRVSIEPVVDITLSVKDVVDGHFRDDDEDLRRQRWYCVHSVGECISPNNTHMLSASESYKPNTQDVGKVLLLEIEGKGFFVTEPVIPFPHPVPRRMIQLYNDRYGRSLRGPSFRVVTYNVLADVYATSEQFPNCPPFALSWENRRQNLLKEILECDPDIICLQEVQQNHFSDFFYPELAKLGYEGMFKPKQREGNIPTVDGCATFYKLNQFDLITLCSINLRYKDNVALHVILSIKKSSERLCITNTHIHANPKNSDVKLWQVYYLLKDLEKFVHDIPVVLCGDFNSLSGSAPHSLLTKGYVDPLHEEISDYHPSIKLMFRHRIPLASAYFMYSRCNLPLQDALKKMDGKTGEPRFTTFIENSRGKFQGTVDYIFYHATKLKLVSLLELIDEEEVRHRALPSVNHSSNHIPIAAEFSYISTSKPAA